MSYISKYTGEEIDAAVEKTQQIQEVIPNPVTSEDGEPLEKLQVGTGIYSVPQVEMIVSDEEDPSATEIKTMSIDGNKFKFPSGNGEILKLTAESSATEITLTEEQKNNLLADKYDCLEVIYAENEKSTYQKLFYLGDIVVFANMLYTDFTEPNTAPVTFNSWFYQGDKLTYQQTQAGSLIKFGGQTQQVVNFDSDPQTQIDGIVNGTGIQDKAIGKTKLSQEVQDLLDNGGGGGSTVEGNPDFSTIYDEALLNIKIDDKRFRIPFNDFSYKVQGCTFSITPAPDGSENFYRLNLSGENVPTEASFIFLCDMTIRSSFEYEGNFYLFYWNAKNSDGNPNTLSDDTYYGCLQKLTVISTEPIDFSVELIPAYFSLTVQLVRGENESYYKYRFLVNENDFVPILNSAVNNVTLGYRISQQDYNI